MTIVTHVTLKEGTEARWDELMRERLGSARSRDGWVGGQVCMPLDSLDRRVIIGTWDNRAAWEAWHEDETFRETRREMDGMQVQPDDIEWHEVLLEVRAQS